MDARPAKGEKDRSFSHNPPKHARARGERNCKSRGPLLKAAAKTAKVHALQREFFGLSSAASCRGRKVRTPQGTVAANGCPPRGEDQSNRDEPTSGRVKRAISTGSNIK